MHTTECVRKIDSMGRLMIPSKLREQYGLEPGTECEFLVTVDNGKVYLCVECPKGNARVEDARQVLRKEGYMKI